MGLTDTERLVVECVRMRLSERNSLTYIESHLHKKIGRSTFYRWQKNVEGKKLKRLYEIARTGFVDQHLERIDQLELIQKLMWENYHKEESPFRKVKILESIANVQPYLSAYYEATKEVMTNPVKSQKGHNNISSEGEQGKSTPPASGTVKQGPG